MLIWAQGVHFYFILVQFMQFPVLDFGLDHYDSEPFNYEGVIYLQLFSALEHTAMMSLFKDY